MAAQVGQVKDVGRVLVMGGEKSADTGWLLERMRDVVGWKWSVSVCAGWLWDLGGGEEGEEGEDVARCCCDGALVRGCDGRRWDCWACCLARENGDRGRMSGGIVEEKKLKNGMLNVSGSL